jgi:hypothetical protein
MLTLLGLAFFCLMTTFGTPDISLLMAGTAIRLPYADVPVSFLGFLIAAPLLLIVIVIYLHVFVAYGRQLEDVYHIIGGVEQKLFKTFPTDRLPTIFNLNLPIARVLTAFIFYWLVPLTLGTITWKAMARPEWGLPMGATTVVVTFGLVFLQIRRCPEAKRWWWNLPRWITLGMLCALSFFVIWQPSLVHRPLDLYRANLEGAWLPNADLRGANLERANLQKAKLKGADLRRARLGWTKLEKAELILAKLQKADLSHANLRHASLELANLREATLFRTDFSEARLMLADFQRAALESAKFRKANLMGSNFENADLTDAALDETVFGNVRLVSTDRPGSVGGRGKTSFSNRALMSSSRCLWHSFGRVLAWVTLLFAVGSD